MKKIIRLTESDLKRIIKRVIKEEDGTIGTFYSDDKSQTLKIIDMGTGGCAFQITLEDEMGKQTLYNSMDEIDQAKLNGNLSEDLHEKIKLFGCRKLNEAGCNIKELSKSGCGMYSSNTFWKAEKLVLADKVIEFIEIAKNDDNYDKTKLIDGINQVINNYK